MNVPEEWRPVVGFEGTYEVSNLGRVRSLDRIATYQRVDQYSGRTLTIERKHKGQLLSPGTAQGGHQFVVLGRRRGFCVHTLVLTAFVGPCPEGMECCHYDGNPANNEVGNLRWDTRLANVQDMIRHGTAQWQKEMRA